MTQAEYEVLASLINGFSTGVAQSRQLNKVWRQASFVAAMIGLFTGKNSDEDVLDDGDVDSFEEKFARAMQAFIAAQTAIGSFWQPVISVTITTPPATPTIGDAYVIPSAATDFWAGNAQSIAVWMGARWKIFAAKNGHGISLPDGRIFEKIGGTYVEKPALDVQSGKWNYAVAGGTANVLTASLSPAPLALNDGFALRVKISQANTGSATLNVNGLGANSIVSQSGAPIVAGYMKIGQIVELTYDGAAFKLMGAVIQQLQADLALYVRTDGNDANSGLSNTAAGAFQTLEGAYNALRSRYNANGFSVTLQFGLAGTYAGLAHNSWPGKIVISGDPANRANYILTGAPRRSPSTSIYTDSSGGGLQLTGVKLKALASANRLFQTAGGFTNLISCDWETVGGASMIIGESGGRVVMTGTHNFSGSTSSIAAMLSGSQLFFGDANPFVGAIVGGPTYAATGLALI